jgi:hypothetical protein
VNNISKRADLFSFHDTFFIQSWYPFSLYNLFNLFCVMTESMRHSPLLVGNK